MSEADMRRAFGMRLKQQRRAMGISQRALGDRIGVHLNPMGRYERGEVWPTVPALIDLSRVLKMPIETLLFGAPTQETSADVREATPDVGQARLMALAQETAALSPSDQLVVIALIEAFLMKIKITQMTQGG